MKPLVKAGLIVGILGAIFALGTASIAALFVFPAATYKLSQSREYLWTARKTNDLTAMVGYFNRSYDLLLDYHGNPKWWYPAVDTDLDVMRANVRQMANVAATVAVKGPGDFAYQQTVQNLQTTILELVDHMELVIDWMTKYSVNFLIPVAVGAVLAAGGLITAWILDTR